MWHVMCSFTMLITPGPRQIFHLFTDLLTDSFISIVYCGKIFPKKEIKIRVVDFAWLIINLKDHVICFTPY